MDVKILIVDDEPYMTELIERLVLANTPYAAQRVSQSEQVLPLLEQERFNLVFLDLRMPGMDGMQLLKEIKRRHPHIDVIIVTAYGTVGTAVEALQDGAADFITKPFANQELLAVLERVIKLQDLTQQNRALREALARKYSLDTLLGNAPSMQALRSQAAEAAAGLSPVFLQGEFGSGKSFLARALHFSGLRATGPFLNLDPASADPAEMEHLIFGRRGAQSRGDRGLLASAEGGTLYISNIEMLPATLQNRLAQWLEQGRFRPAGSGHLESADARLLVSSEYEPEDLAAQGRLQNRLALLAGPVLLRLPPLRARREDIILLAARFLEDLGRQYNKEGARLSDGAVKWLLAHDWPGNLRELENTLERALLLSKRQVIEAESLGRPDPLSSPVFTIDVFSLDQPFSEAMAEAKAKFVREFEDTYLQHHLLKNRGDLAALGNATGLGPDELRALLDRNNLSPKRFRSGA